MPAPFFEDAFFLPLYTFSSFVENQAFIGLWVNIQVLPLNGRMDKQSMEYVHIRVLLSGKKTMTS